MMILAKIIVIFFLIQHEESYADLTKFDVLNSKKYTYTLKDVCTFMGRQNALLVSSIDVNQLDCMGVIYKAHDFCNKKHTSDLGFMRGYIDQKSEKLICQTGDRVQLSFTCPDKNFPELCKKSPQDCQYFQKMMVQNLNLIHHSFIPHTIKGKKTLHCHYTKKGFLEDPSLLKSLL